MRIGDSSNAAPSIAGVHLSITTPFGTYTTPNRLIGCVSQDNEWLWATAWEPTQELFQGVILCLHNDFRLGGLNPGETKKARGKMYIMENNVDLLLERYHRDF